MLGIMVSDGRMKYAEVHATGSRDLQMSRQIYLCMSIYCCG